MDDAGGPGAELERAKLRICKCGLHNNGTLLYINAVGCVVLGRRSVQCTFNAQRVAQNLQMKNISFPNSTVRPTFRDNVKSKRET